MSPFHWNPFLRFPRSSLAGSLFLIVPLILQLEQFDVRSELAVLLEGDQRTLESYEKVQKIVADTEVLVVSMEVPEVFSESGIDAVRRVSAALERGEGVFDVKSLTHSSKPVRKGIGFEMVPLVPAEKLTETEWAELKVWGLGHPLVRNLIVSEDSRHTLIIVTYRRSLRTEEEQQGLAEEIDSALEPFWEEGLSFRTLALPLISAEVRGALRDDVKLMLPVAFLVLTLVLRVTFRSWRYVLLILFNQAVVLLLLPGAIRCAGYSLTVFSVMLLPLLTGIHLTLLAHVYSSFQRARRDGAKGVGAVVQMMDEVFKSSTFAAVTTMAGLGSLMLSDVLQLREFGVMGMVGLGLIYFMTFGPGLALLRLLADLLPVVGRRGQGSKPGMAERWVGLLARKNQLVPILALVVVALVAVGIRYLRTDIRAVEFLGESSPARQAVEALDRDFGGINVVQIELDSGVEGGINNDAYLRYLIDVQQYAERSDGVSGVYSYAQLIAMMNQIWEGGKADAMKLPDNPMLLKMFVLALKTQDYPFFHALADPTGRMGYLILRTRDMPGRRYLDLLGDVVEYAESKKPSGVSISAADGLHSILEADQRIVRSQVHTVGMTAGVIGLVLTLLWRSPWLAILSLITNAIPVGLAMAVAGFAGIPLNSITVMVGAIALGITVDDSVHFTTHWLRERAGGASRHAAVREAFRVKGAPIVASSVALISVFALFALSSFPPVVAFGVLCAVAIVGALVSVLVLLPMLLGGAKVPAGDDGTDRG